MTSSQPRSFTEKVGLLSEVALFAGLSEVDMQAIGHATTMTHCVRGQQILSPYDPPDRIHIIKKGRVRVYRMSPDGKQLTLDIYEEGTILGDMSLLGQDRLAEAYAEAIDDGVICTISPGDLRKLIERYPVVGVNIIRHPSGDSSPRSASSRRWRISAWISGSRASSSTSASGSVPRRFAAR